MKIRSVVALVGLAICFAVPTFAQRKEPTPGEQDRQQLDAHVKKSDEAWNNNDAAALAATFTEDAANVTNKDRFTVGRPPRNIMQTCSSNFMSATISTRSKRNGATGKLPISPP